MSLDRFEPAASLREGVDAVEPTANGSGTRTPASVSPARRGKETLDRLLSRQSAWPLTEPAPPPRELRCALSAALRAPDHGQLRPWRFVIIRDEARQALGDLFVAAARTRAVAGDPERFRSKAFAAPVVIALVAHVRRNHKIPACEQFDSAAAGVMNVLNALHLLGYGAFWATGRNAYDGVVCDALGLGPTDHLLGFLYVGTARHATRIVSRTAPSGFIREWHGVVAAAADAVARTVPERAER